MKSLKFLYRIKTIYDIIFAISTIGIVVIFIDYLGKKVDSNLFWISFIGWISSFAIFILLNVVDMLVRKVFAMERQLQEQHLLPPNDTNDGKN